jgi:hypothetical protein
LNHSYPAAPIIEPSFDGKPADVILLDYVYTLVANSGDCPRQYSQIPGGFAGWIPKERYRTWLVDLLRGHERVLIVTARPERHKVLTLAHLKDVTGWEPHDAFFNYTGSPPPLSKLLALRYYIFPRFGNPDKTGYMGLESNPKTRSMYAKQGIFSLPVPINTKRSWKTLPTPPP